MYDCTTYDGYLILELDSIRYPLLYIHRCNSCLSHCGLVRSKAYMSVTYGFAVDCAEAFCTDGSKYFVSIIWAFGHWHGMTRQIKSFSDLQIKCLYFCTDMFERKFDDFARFCRRTDSRRKNASKQWE